MQQEENFFSTRQRLFDLVNLERMKAKKKKKNCLRIVKSLPNESSVLRQSQPAT